MNKKLSIQEAIENGFCGGEFSRRKIDAGWSKDEIAGYITAMTALRYGSKLDYGIDDILHIARKVVV